MSLIVKTILLGLAFVLSAPAAGKTKYFVYLCFNSPLQLINGILIDLPKLLKILMAKQMLHFFRIPLAPSSSVFPNNLAIYLKDLKLLVLVKSALKLFAPSFE